MYIRPFLYSFVEDAHRRIDGCHLVVVRKVDVQWTVEREGYRVTVECLIRLRIILDWFRRQASDELVDVADSLCWSKRAAIAGRKKMNKLAHAHILVVHSQDAYPV